MKSIKNEIESIKMDEIKSKLGMLISMFWCKTKQFKRLSTNDKICYSSLPTINKGWFCKRITFSRTIRDRFQKRDESQNLKLDELFSADGKTAEASATNWTVIWGRWKINTEKLTSILSSLPYEIDPVVDDELLKEKKKQ
jgi:hypothetical protein